MIGCKSTKCNQNDKNATTFVQKCNRTPCVSLFLNNYNN